MNLDYMDANVRDYAVVQQLLPEVLEPVLSNLSRSTQSSHDQLAQLIRDARTHTDQSQTDRSRPLTERQSRMLDDLCEQLILYCKLRAQALDDPRSWLGLPDIDETP